MKKRLKGIFKNIVTSVIVLTLVLSFSGAAFASDGIWNGGEKVNYVPFYGESNYRPSDWTNSLVNTYQLKWYESPTRQVLKGEFMLVQLRTIQASLERQGFNKLSSNGEILNFNDTNTLVSSAQEEAKILKSLGILSGTPEGFMEMSKSITRSEAAKVITYANDRILRIPATRNAKVFYDTTNHWAQGCISYAYQIGLLNGISDTYFDPDGALTLEQTLQILENEVGYYGITREDVAKAMNQTFKVTSNFNTSNGNTYNEYVTLNKSNITLTVGNTEMVYATITPSNTANKTIIWTSSDDRIATVSSYGLIKAVGTGTVVINATTVNGNNAFVIVTVNSSNNNANISTNSTIYAQGYCASEYYNAFSNEEITFIVQTNQSINSVKFSNDNVTLTQNLISGYDGFAFKVKAANLTQYGETLMTVTLGNNETLSVRICIYQQ